MPIRRKGSGKKPIWLLSRTYQKPAEYPATRALLALPERPTCIFYPDDLSFLGGMSELEKHGLSIPKDMSVVWTFRAVSSERSLKRS